MARPELTLSLQFADKRHRALLPRHFVARCLRAALESPAQLSVRIVDADEGRAERLQDHQPTVATAGVCEGESAVPKGDRERTARSRVVHGSCSRGPCVGPGSAVPWHMMSRHT